MYSFPFSFTPIHYYYYCCYYYYYYYYYYYFFLKFRRLIRGTVAASVRAAGHAQREQSRVSDLFANSSFASASSPSQRRSSSLSSSSAAVATLRTCPRRAAAAEAAAKGRRSNGREEQRRGRRAMPPSAMRPKPYNCRTPVLKLYCDCFAMSRCRGVQLQGLPQQRGALGGAGRFHPDRSPRTPTRSGQNRARLRGLRRSSGCTARSRGASK